MFSIEQCFNYIENFSDSVEQFAEQKRKDEEETRAIVQLAENLASQEVRKEEKSGHSIAPLPEKEEASDLIASAITIADVCLQTIQEERGLPLKKKIEAVSTLLQSIKKFRTEQESKEYRHWGTYLWSFVQLPQGIKSLKEEEKTVATELESLKARDTKDQVEQVRKLEMKKAQEEYKKQKIKQEAEGFQKGLQELEKDFQKFSLKEEENQQKKSADLSELEELAAEGGSSSSYEKGEIDKALLQELEELEEQQPSVKEEDLAELERFLKESEEEYRAPPK